mmetsp:Transcript_5673/g.20605  ORF Transcript_5673/g.20605 Transcript_5673/m.20605 type:complete len:257 (+) Transcript_5673:2314-3084(+)
MMSFVMTPPSVSRPSDSGVTSRRTMSLTSPPRTPACTAAPSATTSSGLTDMFGSFPVSFFTSARTAGMRVEPPTRITSSISSSDSFASRSAFSTGTLQRVMRSSQSSSNLARVRLVSMCFGPSAVAVMNGREMDAEGVDDSSIFAFSAASVSLCSACLSLMRSTPSADWKSFASHSTILLSKSSPPRCVSPDVESTSKTPSPTSRMDTSKVPPPRSKIRIVSFDFFSKPYARLAAVGSLMMRRTSTPAMAPASFVA